MIVYFSNVTNTTHRFVTRLGLPADQVYRIPVHGEAERPTSSFVLITPTYGAGRGTTMVPRQVTAYLDALADHPLDSGLLRGVIASGNTNFGPDYAAAGDVLASQYDIPFLYRFELSGLPEDIDRVRAGLERFW